MRLPIEIGSADRPHRNGKARRQQAGLAEDREFLQHIADIAIGLHQIRHFGVGAFAIAAAVIDKLHQRHIAAGIAAGPGPAIVKDRRGVLAEQGAVIGQLCRRIAGIQCSDRFDQHFRVFDQIGADFGAKGGAFGIAHRGRVKRQRRVRQCQGEGEAQGKAAQLHDRSPFERTFAEMAADAKII